MQLLYADDLEVGMVFDLGKVTITREDMLGFAHRWDPLPMHTDEKSAEQGPFGGLIASGVHTLAVLQRLQADGLFSRSAIVAGRGMDSMRLPVPVRPGDVLHGEIEVTGVRFREDGRAVVRSRGTLANGFGALVLEVHGVLVWTCKSSEMEEERRHDAD